MTDLSLGPNRLDSWKAIADYLRRDVATVRRWEKLGLPVRRVGGRGGSVYAYRTEIDEWLKTERRSSEDAESAAGPADSTESPVGSPEDSVLKRLDALSRRGQRLRMAWIAAACLTVLAGGIAMWRSSTSSVEASDLRVMLTAGGVTAFERDGSTRWHYPFPATHKAVLSSSTDNSVTVEGAEPAIYAATSYRERYPDGQAEGGELISLNLDGEPRRSFAFTDTITVDGRQYGPPWAITAFSVDASRGRPRTAVAAHHFIWSPSLVTLLDDRFQRQRTFVHDGWIETVKWISPSQLLVAGFSQLQNAGLIGLLDPETMEPTRMVAMPRTELNVATAARFNRAVVQMVNAGLIVRTIELSSGDAAVDVVYELSHRLELGRASFSDRYWDTHLALERQGKLDHSRATCPDRDGPRQILIWTRETGWRTERIAHR